MKIWMLSLLVALPLLFASCVGETHYYTETGTLSIPWGAKEGARQPADHFE